MSASFKVFGDFASIAAVTAAMNAFLSNDPGRWASIESALAALACDPTSPDGGTAASWASLAFAVAGGCARFSRPVALTLPVTAVNAGSASGRTPLGGTGGCNRASAAPSAVPADGPSVEAPSEPVFPRPDPVDGPAGAAFFAPARPSGLTAGTFFGGGTAFLAGTLPGPNPVVVTASAEAGGRIPSRSTGTPTAFAAFSPFSTTSAAGSSRRSSRSARSMSATACSPGNRIRPAIRAFRAGSPPLRCTGSTGSASSDVRARSTAPPPADGDAFDRAATRPATAALPALRCNIAIDRGLIKAAVRRTEGVGHPGAALRPSTHRRHARRPTVRPPTSWPAKWSHTNSPC